MSGIVFMIVASVVLLFLLFYSMACYGWFAMQSEEKQTQWFYARKGQPQDLLSQGTIFTDAFLPLFLLLLGAAVVLWIQIPSLAPSLYLRWIFPLFFVAAIVLGLVLAVVAKNNSGRVFAPLQKLLRLMGWGAANMYRKEVGVLPQNNSQQLMEERQNFVYKEILRFRNETVKDIQTRRLDIVDLDIRTSFPEVLQMISDNKFSRIPVYSGSKDNIVGILYIKDLLPYLNKSAQFHWSSLVRPYLCVPETKKIDNLLREFQTKKVHLAVVVDEYGGVSGLVTLEDIIEEVLGEIHDEYDDESRNCIKLNHNTYILDAKLLIPDFCKTFELEDSYFDEFGEDVNTVARLLIEIIGDIPRKHQIVRYRQFLFEILSMDERHISKVKMTRI